MKKTACLPLCGLILAALFSVGCPPTEKPTLPVKGKVVENGASVKLPGGSLPPGVKAIDVVFYELNASNQPGDMFGADVAEDGSFTVVGRGKGVPAGKYRIVVVAAASSTPIPGGGGGRGKPPGSGPPGVPPGGANTHKTVIYSGSLAGLPDRFKGAFGPENSPLIVDVDGPTSLVVDVGTKKVAKE